MQLLPAFGKTRRAFHNGEPRDKPTNQNVLLRLTGTLGDRPVTFLAPYTGRTQRLTIDNGAAHLRMTRNDWLGYRFCNLQLNIPPPFKGGQCRTAYDYSVRYFDTVDGLEKVVNQAQIGPLEPLRFNAEGLLNMAGNGIAGGGESRIVAPKVFNVRRRDGLPDDCGNIPGPQRYFCPANPKPLLASGPNQSRTEYIANGWLLAIRLFADGPSSYQVDIRV
jgi:hypothetical protein